MVDHQQPEQKGDAIRHPEEKQIRGERQAENKERGEAEGSIKDWTEHVKKVRAEKKASGRSGVTGVGADSDGKGGFASAKLLLAGPAEETGTVIDYKPVKHNERSFSLGMDYEENERGPAEKLGDFAQAAAKRATDPAGWSAWFNGEVEKIVGIGIGLNEAKEETKAAVAAGFKALTDGTVTDFLSRPNAINEPLFKTVANVFDAVSSDPNATNKALEALGNAVIKASNDYSAMSKEEQGKMIGKTMFAMINPEGSTEGAEVALKIADKVATRVDKAVMDTIATSLKAAERAAQQSPEIAQQAKQRLLDYMDSKGLLGPKLQYEGIPEGYFEGMQPTRNAAKDNYMAMSSDSEAGNMGGRRPMDKAQREAALERNPPSEGFKVEMAKAIENLDPHLKEYLEQKGVEIKTCRRVTDIFPDQKPTTMGCYSIKDNCIYIAEEVRSGGHWVKNFDVDFNIRHETGHAFSYTKKGYEQVSADVKFQKLFAQDIKSVPQEVLKALDFDITSREGIEFAREEVFADSFAHATGCATKNRYSQLIRDYFPNCRTYF